MAMKPAYEGLKEEIDDDFRPLAHVFDTPSEREAEAGSYSALDVDDNHEEQSRPDERDEGPHASRPQSEDRRDEGAAARGQSQETGEGCLEVGFDREGFWKLVVFQAENPEAKGPTADSKLVILPRGKKTRVPWRRYAGPQDSPRHCGPLLIFHEHARTYMLSAGGLTIEISEISINIKSPPNYCFAGVAMLVELKWTCPNLLVLV